jgi:hypothetical protein
MFEEPKPPGRTTESPFTHPGIIMCPETMIFCTKGLPWLI